MPLPSEYEALGSSSTLLKITAVGLPPYAARGITHAFAHIEAAANLHRTINGELNDFGFDQFQKYALTLSASDQQPPAWDGIWPGLEVIVECAAEFAYLTSSEPPSRPVVSGSSRVEGDYTFYRPILIMRVAAFDDSFAEWEAGNSWNMTLEEI